MKTTSNKILKKMKTTHKKNEDDLKKKLKNEDEFKKNKKQKT